MPNDWSPEEVAATVTDYFAMLALELRGESFNKRDHNRRLQLLLHDRSSGAIEFKHQNISAVLVELGFPYVEGYKPRSNYQELLRDEVVARLAAEPALAAAAAAAVAAPAPLLPEIGDVAGTFVPAPKRENPRGRWREQPIVTPTPRLGTNYLEREARNSSLGLAGETFVLSLEHRRLWQAGARHLADRVEHVSATRGDGLGFDILSFEPDGRERLIEVKTTTFGAMTPFFASAREVSVSSDRADQYRLYRVFRFRADPKVFVLQGALNESCVLDAVQYRASIA